MGADFDFFVIVEHVELGKRYFVSALAAYAVARSNYIERTYSSGSARCCAVFAAGLSNYGIGAVAYQIIVLLYRT